MLDMVVVFFTSNGIVVVVTWNEQDERMTERKEGEENLCLFSSKQRVFGVFEIYVFLWQMNNKNYSWNTYFISFCYSK